MRSDSLRRFLGLFDLRGKREIKRYGRSLTVTSEDFSDVVLAARIAGLGPYEYACHFLEVRPDCVEPTREQFEALGASSVGVLSGRALKTARKIDQLFRDRRLLSVHLFYMRSHRHWHMFYFDQRDYQAPQNHWKHGPHIHYCHSAFTSEPLGEVWLKATASVPDFPPSVHIRYDYHHNRKRRR